MLITQIPGVFDELESALRRSLLGVEGRGVERSGGRWRISGSPHWLMTLHSTAQQHTLHFPSAYIHSWRWRKKKKSSTEAQSSSNSAANMLSRTFVSPWRNTGGEVQIDQLGFYFSSRVFLIIDSEYVCKFLNFWCQKCSKLLPLHWSCTTFRSAPLMVSVLKITKKYKLTPLDVCEIYAFMSLSPVHNSEEYHPPTSSQKHPSQVPSSSQVAKGFEFKY